MNEITCFHSCPMKFDLENSQDKLVFLKENWPSFGQIEDLVCLSRQELICTICLLDVILSAINKKEFQCAKEEIADLVKLRFYIFVLI